MRFFRFGIYKKLQVFKEPNLNANTAINLHLIGIVGNDLTIPVLRWTAVKGNKKQKISGKLI
jgi:hypothetical protein